MTLPSRSPSACPTPPRTFSSFGQPLILMASETHGELRGMTGVHQCLKRACRWREGTHKKVRPCRHVKKLAALDALRVDWWKHSNAENARKPVLGLRLVGAEPAFICRNSSSLWVSAASLFALRLSAREWVLSSAQIVNRCSRTSMPHHAGCLPTGQAHVSPRVGFLAFRGLMRRKVLQTLPSLYKAKKNSSTLIPHMSHARLFRTNNAVPEYPCRAGGKLGSPALLACRR